MCNTLPRKTIAAALAIVSGVSIVSCTAGAAGGADRLPDEPTAAHEDGASVRVHALERSGGRTFVEFTVVNGSANDVALSTRYRPITLLDGNGTEHSAAEEPIEVPSHSRARIRLEFDGEVAGESATLRINPGQQGNRSPEMTVRDLPVRGGRVEFEGSLPQRRSVEGVQAQHPSGVSVSLGELDFRDDEIQLSFQAVNGHRYEMKLANGSINRAFLMDNTGRKYFLIAPDGNRDVAIPAGERASGVLRFAGRIGPDAQRLSLHFNDRTGGDNEHTRSPRMRIGDIPIEREVSND